jgi:hypothetical protein
MKEMGRGITHAWQQLREWMEFLSLRWLAGLIGSEKVIDRRKPGAVFSEDHGMLIKR